jgi:hypothetical protein
MSCICSTCKLYSWPSLWRLKKLNFDEYWFEIPKNASYAIKRTYFGKHGRGWPTINQRKMWQISKENYNYNMIPHIVYRDPVERFVSSVMYYIGGGFGTIQEIKGIVDINFNAFIDNMLEKYEYTPVTEFPDHHFYPQTYFFIDELQYFRDVNIVRMNELKEKMNIKFHNNKSRSLPLAREYLKKFKTAELSADQIKTIKEKYAADYNFFEKYNM